MGALLFLFSSYSALPFSTPFYKPLAYFRLPLGTFLSEYTSLLYLSKKRRKKKASEFAPSSPFQVKIIWQPKVQPRICFFFFYAWKAD